MTVAASRVHVSASSSSANLATAEPSSRADDSHTTSAALTNTAVDGNTSPKGRTSPKPHARREGVKCAPVKRTRVPPALVVVDGDAEDTRAVVSYENSTAARRDGTSNDPPSNVSRLMSTVVNPAPPGGATQSTIVGDEGFARDVSSSSLVVASYAVNAASRLRNMASARVAGTTTSPNRHVGEALAGRSVATSATVVPPAMEVAVVTANSALGVGAYENARGAEDATSEAYMDVKGVGPP